MSITKRLLETRLLAGLLIGLCGALVAPTVLVASDAFGEDEYDAELELKEEIQRQYRDLLRNKAIFQRNAVTAREEYAEANRRNYPRGEARKQYLINEKEALDALAEVEVAIEKLHEQGRRDGALPGWFAEVEDEPLSLTQPAAPAEDDDRVRDREGRNPLYFDDE